MCVGVRRRMAKAKQRPLNILLSNGRFPVTIDLARQLRLAGHNVFVVDPMHYHVCKFSAAVKRSYQTPSPHIDAPGYIAAVINAVLDAKIDLVIPMHEEILYLSSHAAHDPFSPLAKRLFAPPFDLLLQLHSKWGFSQLLKKHGLDCPETILCKNMEGVEKLFNPETTGGGQEKREWALKPVFGRASTSVYHIRPDENLPDVEVGEERKSQYVAQEWLAGDRFCCYAVVQQRRLVAFSVYPVQDTIDGSSCVYFKSIEHQPIRVYVDKLVQSLPPFSGQISLDMISTVTRLVAIECNPRATSGIHLYSGTPLLAQAFLSPPSPHETIVPKKNARRQLAPGMLMWQPESHGVKEYLRHMRRLMGSKDVIFSGRDLMPSLMQPFLLTSYYEICRERGLELPEMFQWDLMWEPDEVVLRSLENSGERRLHNEGERRGSGNEGESNEQVEQNVERSFV